MLSRRTNLKTLAEIEAERRAPRQPEGNWRNGVVREGEADWRVVSAEVRAERDRRVRELRLAGHSVPDIVGDTGLTYGQVQASVSRQGLRGIGGAGKGSAWRMHAARDWSKRNKKTGDKHESV